MKQVLILKMLCLIFVSVSQNGCTCDKLQPANSKTSEISSVEKPQKESDIVLNSIGMKFVHIPAGEFMMGSPSDEKGRDNDEGPVHSIKISKGFWMGIYEVTQAQYQAIMGSNPSTYRGDNLPVVFVSWNDATEFCKRLSDKENVTYRLPTEAEWEYACRAGTRTRFSFGDNDSSLEEYAWYFHNGCFSIHPVGQKKPNAFGLYDMHGNVWEWCQDWYSSDYYTNSPNVDPQGPDRGSSRVLRGGSWFFFARYCRSANRNWFVYDFTNRGLYGFRVISLDLK
jgi:formylglycine-generating enzyme required for sulfatase activity